MEVETVIVAATILVMKRDQKIWLTGMITAMPVREATTVAMGTYWALFGSINSFFWGRADLCTPMFLLSC